MLLTTALGVVLLIVVAAVAVVTRHAAPLNDDRALPAKPPPIHGRLSLAATDIPTINAATIVAILAAFPVLLHLYSIAHALFNDPQSPLYVLLRWLASF